MTGKTDAGRRRRNPLAGALTKYTVDAVVTETGPVTPSMRRILLRTDGPVPFAWTPGRHVRVQLNDPLSLSGIVRPGQTLRTYTIWEFDAGEHTLELRAHLYGGEGIGLAWARKAAPGDRVTLWWPQGDFVLREAPYHLFVGEETASVAFGPMIRALGPSARVYGVLESEGPEHDPPMPGPHPLRRVHRDGASAASSAILLNAVAALELPADAGFAYLAGEARTCRMVRDHLTRDRGWPKTAIKLKPFWAPGKRGLH
ncbi:siderophore-interacting protein [Streptomyces coffeae]|uniref:Siderophore-interacting protein n=1 Tax=Streptomyces coffeae TaxID=621382 RepID=A0ABS1N4Z9_9ACTN|nr:siderophore-interacting protein [Streptomyces coffeae]MBL1095083.1 siderophore-interacting protein [Streptomyces coffeae]